MCSLAVFKEALFILCQLFASHFFLNWVESLQISNYAYDLNIIIKIKLFTLVTKLLEITVIKKENLINLFNYLTEPCANKLNCICFKLNFVILPLWSRIHTIKFRLGLVDRFQFLKPNKVVI
ncbi:hypothetical protein BpHYR1_037658 [Brachionus plicatilis]|uniref:Uncharacterized protein n=1 Tax=Brachionus plicatilis TaxID=10195 RepID=A0A3M7RPX4_BRAPC|nr:hypothetical protein BpHYR1_037658 [Brachionus plicatilis]